jgi:heptose-I-phosphate ethanolaminephosphotransferase
MEMAVLKKNSLHAIGIFFSPIKKMPVFFVFLFILGLLCLCIEQPLEGMPPAYKYRFIELFTDLYIICLVLSFIPRKIRMWIQIIVCIILYSVAIADVFCYDRFDSYLTPTMLQLAKETNKNETEEFFGSYISLKTFLSPIGIIILLSIIHIFVSIKKCGGLLINKSVKYQPFWGAVILALLIYGCIVCYPNKSKLHKLMSQTNTSEMERMWNKRYGDGLYLPIYRLTFSLYANHLTEKQVDNLLANIDKVQVDSCTFKSPNIVLIIGESYNKHHSQLYGYEKPTTPRQLRRAQRGDLTVFTDVIAPWNLTSEVFKNSFSMYGFGDKGTWSDYPLFTELFRKAGYHVTFLTNQFVMNPDEKPADFSGGFFLNNKALSNAQFNTRNDESHRYDDGLLEDYDLLKRYHTNHNLIIFHLIGQHVGYGNRYPADRQKFGKKDYIRPDLNDKELGILSDYDNATLYNDSIVDEIIKRFEKQNAIVIYMPDHGEEVFDDIHIFGRMHSARLTARMVRQEFEVPFWIWCSHSYIIGNPDIFKEILSARNRPFMTDNIAQLLVFLGGISCPDYKPGNNPISPVYNTKRERLLKSTNVNYDSLMSQNHGI